MTPLEVLLIVGVIFLFVFTVLTNTTFLTIDPGQRGVIFKRFGGGLNKEKVYKNRDIKESFLLLKYMDSAGALTLWNVCSLFQKDTGNNNFIFFK